MASSSGVSPALWRVRLPAHLCAFMLFYALLMNVMATPVEKSIASHNFSQDYLPPLNSSSLNGHRIPGIEANETSFVQGGEKTMWVGLLDQEFIMQSSHALVHAFKRASKYIYSRGFVRTLHLTNPWLRYSITSLEQKLQTVKQLEKIANGSRLRYRKKPESAAKLLAHLSLDRAFPLRSKLLGSERRQYAKHMKELTQALLQAKAGTSALELIMASKTLPLYSWTESLLNHPIVTLKNTVVQAFEDTIGGVTGLFSSEVKSSCFSFAHRVNTIAPYTVVYPGGILGSIMKGLVRSYFLVFQQSLVNFKGIFALLIGVICKTRIIQSAANALKPIFRMARRGARAYQAFKSKTIAMRGDPIGSGLMDRLLKRDAVVLTTILFQMHAVNVEKQWEEADEFKSALSGGGGGGSWALAEGLFIGAAEFSRSFHRLVRKYISSADAYVKACQALRFGAFGQSSQSQESPPAQLSAEDIDLESIVDEALEFFSEAHPEASGGDEPLTTAQKVELLRLSCRNNRRFVQNFKEKQAEYTQRVVLQMVRLLQYHFKYFKTYISDILSIFYESSVAMLETKINDSLGGVEGANSPADEVVAAEARHAARRSAAQAATEDSHLPRKLFRATKFASEAEKLAYGLFHATGALSLFQVTNGETREGAAAQATALHSLTKATDSMRKGLGDIYKRFLNSQLLLSRVEKHAERIKILELIAKCQTPLEEKTEEEKRLCGTTVTSEIDEDEFIVKSLVSLNLPISSPENDIAFHSHGGVTRVFEHWAQFTSEKRLKHHARLAQLALNAGSSTVFITHLRRAALDKLTFRRFEYVEGTAKVILYDENGRTLTFTGDDESSVRNLVTAAHDKSGRSITKPDPLDCNSSFTVKESNKGTLSFFVAAGQRRGEASGHRHQNFAEAQITPAIQLEGSIEYNDERRELLDIQNDPSAIRDTIVAHFLDKRGRIAAETLAGVLMLLHRRAPIFWKSSPVEFLQNVTPKMFFDILYVLSTQAYDQSEATVMLDGKLYTFPKSFGAMKDIVLSALNRAIVRMHSLNASDAALLITMGSVHFAYKKIQKHRTGRTATMHLFLKEVNHIMNILRTSPDQLKVLYPECSFISKWGEPTEEGVLKCAVFRFMKIGSLANLGDSEEEIITYVTAFVTKLAELKGEVTWRSYLNLDYFLKSAKKYGKTAAKYKYEVLYNQINDLPGTDEEETELARLMKKLHPSVSGHRPPRPKKKQGLLNMLTRFKDNFNILPTIVRERVALEWRSCLARMRRFFGNRRSMLRSWRISPKVIQGPHFMGALKFAEVTTYPDLDSPRNTFIEVGDLEEFSKVLLTLETVTGILDSPPSMYNTVTQVRATPSFTPSAREEHEKLMKRAKALGQATVKIAAGWVLKAAGGSGIGMALGLLALQDVSGRFVDKALQLRYLTSEALTFLNSSLDLAYIIKHLPPQTPRDAEMLRFNLNSGSRNTFVVKAQCEPKGLGVNTAESVKVADAIRRIEDVLAKQDGLPDGPSDFERCSALVGSILRRPFTSTTSLPHDALLASDAFGLCFLLLRLRAYIASDAETVTIDELLQTIYIDRLPLAEHLSFLQQRRADMDERKSRAKYISPLLRFLLIATVDKLGESLGGLSFRSYDSESKMISFQYTLEEVSPPGSPADTLAFAADLLLGTNNEKKHRFVAFAFDGPQFLMDWYRYVLPEKMRGVVDAAREQNIPITYQDMMKLSNVYTVTDLADLAYSLRQSSKINVNNIARKAALNLMGDANRPPLERYGLAYMLMELVNQAAHLKKKCMGKALEDYETFSSLTVLDKELFRYDCFYTKMNESHSFADVARSVSEKDIRDVMRAIDAAYEAETKALYDKLLSSNIDHTVVANVAFKIAQQFPIIGMVDTLTSDFLKWVREKRSWQEILPNVKAQRSAKWVASYRTTTLNRPVTNREHPLLMNPFQILIDIMLASIAGSAKRRQLPVLAPLQRLKAIFASIKPGKKSRAEYKADVKRRQRTAENQFEEYTKDLSEGNQEPQVLENPESTQGTEDFQESLEPLQPQGTNPPAEAPQEQPSLEPPQATLPEDTQVTQ